LVLGLAGVALVVARRLTLGLGTWAFVGLLGITFGTLYQKKFCAEMESRTGSAVQFLVAAILLAPLALLFDDGVIDWTPTFIASLA
jgi:drug/metabolite transporter (DMT)-like permease